MARKITSGGLEEFAAIPPGSYAPLRVPAVIFAAAVLVLVLVFLLTGGLRQLIQPRFEVSTYLADSGGLAEGAPVELNGVRVGRIERLELSGSTEPQRIVKITMRLRSRFRELIPQDSLCSVSADNLLGDQYININQGHSAEQVTEDGELKALVQPAQFNSADLVQSLKDTIARVDTILSGIESGQTQLGHFVREETFYDELRARLVTLQNAVSTLGDRRTVIGKAFYTDELYNQIRGPILALDKRLESFQKGEGAGSLLRNTAEYDNARKQLASVTRWLDETKAGKGAGALLTKDDQYRQIQKSLAAIDSALSALLAGQGQIGQLLASSKLYDSLNAQSSYWRKFLGEFRVNPQKFLRIKVF